jgi:hypothetical protein
MIDHLTHFYRKGRPPFQSLSALPEEEALRLMQNLYVEGSTIWERFKDPQDYLLARRTTEAWLQEEFIARGGQPQQPNPVYMVFGRTCWLDLHGDPATLATTAEIEVPISLFTAQDISFTYPDSMITRRLVELKEANYCLPDLHGKLFTLDEMVAIVTAHGLPGTNWGTELPDVYPNYIEAQVWNMSVLLEFLNS